MVSIGRGWFKSSTVAIAIGVSLLAGYGSARATSFSTALVQCTAVTLPAAPPNCPPAGSQDPLKSGSISINSVGDVTIHVNGAKTNTAYTVTLLSPDSKSTFVGNPVPILMTDNKGNGRYRKEAAFAFGKAAAGNLILTSNGVTQFISGLAVSGGLQSGSDFEPGLVKCADVSIPAAITGCGTDPLGSSLLRVENDTGDLMIKLSGAAHKATYTAMLLPANGNLLQAKLLGNLSATDGKGNGAFLVVGGGPLGPFPPGSFTAGTVVLSNGSTVEFLSGFKVTQKPPTPTVSQGSLVRCADLTDPVPSNCGGDQLDGGSYQVQANGKLSVGLNGAAVSTNYEAFFRPLNATNAGDIDTGLALPTNKDGNAKGSIVFFKAGGKAVASGSFIVKQQGTNQPDQFVTGFVVR